MGLCEYSASFSRPYAERRVFEDDDTKNFIPLYIGEEVTTKKEAGVIMTIE